MTPQRIFIAAISLASLTAACSDSTDSGSAETISDATLATIPGSQDTLSPDSTVSDSVGSADSTDSTSGDSTDSTGSIDSRLDRAAEALKNGDFTTMLRLLQLSGIANDIEGNEVTILAPTDTAFSDISSDELENLLTNPTQIDDVLRRHIIDQLLTYDELSTMTEVTTMSGDTLVVSNENGEVTVDGAVVNPPEADAVSGENGQEVSVLPIDRVLLEGS